MAESKTLSIRNAIIGLIQGIQIDDEAAFSSVSGVPVGEFDDYPSVRVLPSVLDNEKAAFRQTDRSVTFIVRTYLPYGANEQATNTDKMYLLTDLIFDQLDESDEDEAFRTALGTYILTTDRGEWTVEEVAGGVLLYADINVEVSYSKDL